MTDSGQSKSLAKVSKQWGGLKARRAEVSNKIGG
jgi:hypothetical protein